MPEKSYKPLADEDRDKIKTLSYARHIGREIAVLTLSSLSSYPEDELELVDISELLEKAIRVMTSEAQEALVGAGKELETIEATLERYDPELDTRTQVAGSGRDLRELQKDVNAELKELRTRLLVQIEELGRAVHLIGDALDMPLMLAFTVTPETRRFALQLVIQYRKNRKEVDQAVDEVSAEWPISRMHAIDRCVVRMATTEMLYELSSSQATPVLTPLPVIINEAVEIAKKYGTQDSHRFVNGVLRNLMPQAEEKRKQNS